MSKDFRNVKTKAKLFEGRLFMAEVKAGAKTRRQERGPGRLETQEGGWCGQNGDEGKAVGEPRPQKRGGKGTGAARAGPCSHCGGPLCMWCTAHPTVFRANRAPHGQHRASAITRVPSFPLNEMGNLWRILS